VANHCGLRYEGSSECSDRIAIGACSLGILARLASAVVVRLRSLKARRSAPQAYSCSLGNHGRIVNFERVI